MIKRERRGKHVKVQRSGGGERVQVTRRDQVYRYSCLNANAVRWKSMAVWPVLS